MKNGRIFVVSAPSGSGKTTICRRVLKRTDNLAPSVSMTTRRPRLGEKDKKDYYYVSEKFFKEKIKKHFFLEWAKNFGYFYGTPKHFVLAKMEKGNDILLSIDVKGARQIRKKFPNSILIFIKPPSLKELLRRLNSRNSDTSCEVGKRLRLAKTELKALPMYDYVVVNKTLKKAVDKVVSIIKEERKG